MRTLPAVFLIVLAALAWPAGSSAFFESQPGCQRSPNGTRAMALAANGDAIVTGCLHTAGQDKMLTIRFRAADGVVVWSALYPGEAAGNDAATAVAIDAVGNVIVTGFNADAPFRKNMRTVKYDGATGAQLWASKYEAEGGSIAYAIALNAAGDVFVTGDSSIGGVSGSNIRTIKYDGATGAQLWAVSPDLPFTNENSGQAIAVDANGDAFVSGWSGRHLEGSAFTTIKYAGANGALQWIRHLGTNDRGADGTLAPDGSFVALGSTGVSGGSVYRVVKYAAATGEPLWNQSLPLPSGGAVSSLGVDSQGNVFVTGFTRNEGADMHTLKLSGWSGLVLWNVAYNGAGNGDDFAYALAVDANGDAVVTGMSRDSAKAGDDNLRTIKYRGGDGAPLWTASYPGEPGYSVAIDRNRDVIVAAHAYSLAGYGYTVIKYSGATGARLWRTASAKVMIPTSSPGPLSGVWWNPSESGWGIDFTQRGNIVFAAWYTYDASGNPKWFVAPHCALPGPAASGACSETVYEVAGPRFFGFAFDPAAAQVTPAGSLQLSFQDGNSGTVSYSVAGQSRTIAISRQPLPSAEIPPPVNFTDLWWDPSQPGWGVAVTHQFKVMFLAWYVYDSAGKPVWYVASNCDVSAGDSACSGKLYRTTGPAFGAAFDPSQVHAIEVGSVGLSFTDPNNGVLNFSVDGVTGYKAITRQVF